MSTLRQAQTILLFMEAPLRSLAQLLKRSPIFYKCSLLRIKNCAFTSLKINLKIRYLLPLFLWALGIVNFVQPFDGFLFYFATFIFWLLLVSHLIECVILRKRILSSTDTPTRAFAMTFLFGVIYLVSIELKTQE